MSNAPKWQAVAFNVGGQTLLIAVSHIVEIIDALPCTKLARTKPWFLGLASSRGNILPVSDLAGLLFGENTAKPKQGRYILVRKDDETFALLVDDVTGLKKYPVSALVVNNDGVSERLKPYVLEFVNDGESAIPVFDPGLLVNSDQFLNPSTTPAAGSATN